MSEVSVAELWVDPIEESEEEQTPPQNEIPLDIRISYADEYWAQLGRLTAGQLAHNLGTNDRWVYRLVDDLGIPSSDEFLDANGDATYPDFTLGVLDAELNWRRDFKDVPRFVSERMIADTFGQSLDWVRENLAAIENIRQYTISQKITGKKRPHYGKTVLNKLRPVAMEFPLDNGWPTRKELAEKLGMPLRWVNEQLELGGYESVERRAAESGKILLYEMPETLDFLQQRKAERPKPAGDWMTDKLIGEQLGHSVDWVRARLAPYSELGEPRLDDYEHPRMHYPPQVYEALRAQSEWLETLPEASDYLTLSDIATWMGVLEDEAQERLEEYAIETEMWRDGRGRLVEGYTPDAIATIKDIEREAIHYTLDAQNVVGSLKSRIRLREQAIEGLDLFGADETNSQRAKMHAEVRGLRRALNHASKVLNMLEDNAYETSLVEDDSFDVA